MLLKWISWTFGDKMKVFANRRLKFYSPQNISELHCKTALQYSPEQVKHMGTWLNDNNNKKKNSVIQSKTWNLFENIFCAIAVDGVHANTFSSMATVKISALKRL